MPRRLFKLLGSTLYTVPCSLLMCLHTPRSRKVAGGVSEVGSELPGDPDIFWAVPLPKLFQFTGSSAA